MTEYELLKVELEKINKGKESLDYLIALKKKKIRFLKEEIIKIEDRGES